MPTTMIITVSDTDHTSGNQHTTTLMRRVRSAIGSLPKLLFPYLPGAAQIAGLILAAATVAAIGIAWYGNNAGAGVGLALFTSIMLTAFATAAAYLPRLAYSWLHRNRWFPGSDGFAAVAAVVGAHAPIFAFSISNQTIAADHHSTYVGTSAVGLIGTALWLIHEALNAKKTFDLHREQAGEQ